MKTISEKTKENVMSWTGIALCVMMAAMLVMLGITIWGGKDLIVGAFVTGAVCDVVALVWTILYCIWY